MTRVIPGGTPGLWSSEDTSGLSEAPWNMFVRNTRKSLATRLRSARTAGFSIDPLDDPFTLLDLVPDILRKENEGRRRAGVEELSLEPPKFQFRVCSKGDRKWVMGEPNGTMAILHRLFCGYVKEACERIEEKLDQGFKKGVTILPSATAFKEGSRVSDHVLRHQQGQYFYIVDIRHAYESIDRQALMCLLTGIVCFDRYEEMIHEFQRSNRFGQDGRGALYRVYEDPFFVVINFFFELFMTSPSPRGLVVGAPSSPYLFNLFMEIALDRGLRYYARVKDMTYRRYADDLVFSSATPFWKRYRKVIRERIASAGLPVNHRKSRVLYLGQGAIHLTGFALAQGTGDLVFPQKKRKKLWGMMRTFIRRGEGNPNVIRGHIAHFEDYLHAADGVATASDGKMLRLIYDFRQACIERRL